MPSSPTLSTTSTMTPTSFAPLPSTTPEPTSLMAHVSLQLDHRTHFFIFADSAKPIFSRYDDAIHYMNFFSVFQALLAHEPELRSIQLPSGHVIVFLHPSPLIFVAIHPHSMSMEHMLRDQLMYLYQFVLFMLSKSQLHQLFQSKPQLDLASILGPASLTLLHSVCDLFDQDLKYALACIESIPFSSQVRKQFGLALVHGGQMIKNSTTKKCLYGMLLYRNTLLTLIRPKTHSLHPIDLSHVFTLATTQDQFKENEHWLPICLPKFNDQGFLFCYLKYFHAELCLILCSNDQHGFYELQKYQAHTYEYLQKHDLLNPTTIHSCPIPILPSQFVQDSFLLHFVYKSKQHVQFFQSHVQDQQDSSLYVMKYKSLQAMLHERGSTFRFVWLEDDEDSWTALAWDTNVFEFYCLWKSGIPRATAIHQANTIVKWVKNHEQDLFIMDAPTFDW